MQYLEREKQVLTRKVEGQLVTTSSLLSCTEAVSEAMAVTKTLEGELGQVQKVVQEGEETVARLRGQLEELQEREEATQLQLAHALAQVRPHNTWRHVTYLAMQVDKAMSERDIYARAVSLE